MRATDDDRGPPALPSGNDEKRINHALTSPQVLTDQYGPPDEPGNTQQHPIKVVEAISNDACKPSVRTLCAP
jgi:hypothetical protein